MDTDDVSSLSLFLYNRALIVLAKDDSEDVCAANLYTFQDSADIPLIFNTDTLIHSANTSGKLFIHDTHFVLVPQELFDPSHCAVYLNFHSETSPVKKEIYYEGVHSNTVQVVGCAEKDLLSALDASLPDLEVSSGAAFYLSYLLDNAPPTSDQQIFLLPGPGALYLGAFENGELQLFNYFIIHTEQDLLKFLFAVVKQLSFDPHSLRLCVVGDLIHIFSTIDQLTPFFKHVDHITPYDKLSFRAGLETFRNTGLIEGHWTL
ncbi:DUF3822 family protein [Lunatimonas salinarum]|uniref:DUF3822 family protein n=1 Tax=Lunatimonas salinarum TaxID=1774590 RepID=UPI001AE01925|nr:DUF3822 family protein [Lunatimonas salinarum]